MGATDEDVLCGVSVGCVQFLQVNFSSSSQHKDKNCWISKEYMWMQDIWKLEKHWAWSGIVHSDLGIITSGDINIGSKRIKSDYLNVFRTVCYWANIVYNWFNWKKKVQMVRWVCWYPLSSTHPNNIGQIEKKNYLLCIIVWNVCTSV